MSPVEIEKAISELAARPFERETFPFQFLEAFGNKATTIKSLKKGTTNRSDIGGVLQRNNIHLATTGPGGAEAGLVQLRQSAATKKYKVKFILATDGEMIVAEELATGEVRACEYHQLDDHFGFFLLLAGIIYTKEIADTKLDRDAVRRLNKLYIELLNQNPDWASDKRRHDLNHFMARLIFCLFAEDTDIFFGDNLFSATIEQMSGTRGGQVAMSNTHEVIAGIFGAMNIAIADRAKAGVPAWADAFPYVNGGLFSGSPEVPKFSRMARTYLLNAGKLNWKKINPDIFGSMIQAVADDEERGSLGMHYTSVPNILKLLNPLFLDDLREQLAQADKNPRKLLNLKNRMARIRVFDPACGSGNFLVIAYKEMRKLEAEINRRRGDDEIKSIIPLTNFRGIELRDFAAEIARLALIIAEYQCDVTYRGQKEALLEFLPLDAKNWITCGNALRLDWLDLWGTTRTAVKVRSDDLFGTPLEQAEIDFANEGGETYICGNPPYLGYNKRSTAQKEDLDFVFEGRARKWGNLDYVSGWFLKAADFLNHVDGQAALVATNSICQGGQVPILWPILKSIGARIAFAYTSFKWANLASHNAGITVVVIGLSVNSSGRSIIFNTDRNGSISQRKVDNINGYLVSSKDIYVEKRSTTISDLAPMNFGNHPYYGAALFLEWGEAKELLLSNPDAKKFLRPIYGSTEVINRKSRACIWVDDCDVDEARKIPWINDRLKKVREDRSRKKNDSTAQKLKDTPHRFRDRLLAKEHFIAVPQTTSENREYLPCDLLDHEAIVTFKCYALYDAPLWNMALIASRLHWVWIGTVCGRMRTDFSYSNTLGWNTFPVPELNETGKADLTKCAENILLAREAHFPATIADLYKKDAMPENLSRAHANNDETLERIYIGRRFKNDTERLEKLFELYTQMVAKERAL